MKNGSLSEFRGFAEQLARAAAERILSYFGKPGPDPEWKADLTPVTRADREAEEIMRGMIRARFPDHGIVGEEFGPERQGAEFVWILDPIDGTKSFVAGTPQFGTLICLCRRGVPWLGVMNFPVTGQMLIGDGTSTDCNGTPVHVRAPRPLSESIVLTTDLSAPAIHQNGAGWAQVMKAAGKVFTWGDCHGYQLLAMGGVDAMCDPVMKRWDLLALIPVIRGAGGVITDWQGRDPARGTSCVAASSPALHAELIARLNG